MGCALVLPPHPTECVDKPTDQHDEYQPTEHRCHGPPEEPHVPAVVLRFVHSTSMRLDLTVWLLLLAAVVAFVFSVRLADVNPTTSAALQIIGSVLCGAFIVKAAEQERRG